MRQTDAVSQVRRRPGGRSAEVGARVREATLALLAEQGYEALQLSEVAVRAGVNKATVYRRWATRPRLVAALVTDLADERVPTPDTGTLCGDLAAMLAAVTALLEDRAVRAVLRAVVTLADDDTEVDDLRRSFWDAQLADAAVVVTRAVARDELPVGTEPRLFLERVFGPVYFRMLLGGRGLTPAELDVLSRTGR
ncbi:TetR/AcrR family transcriptional regulator [Pimelobacter simplex]|uniref:TetR/AcrR family transcriptional regulator n=1 Tax=Nocardioides simplex TaxID=2045 RepID=UPI003AAF19FC